MKVQVKRWMVVGLMVNGVWMGGARAEPDGPLPTVVALGAFVESYGAWGAGPQRDWRAVDARSRTWAISLAAMEAGISGPIARGRRSFDPTHPFPSWSALLQLLCTNPPGPVRPIDPKPSASHPRRGRRLPNSGPRPGPAGLRTFRGRKEKGGDPVGDRPPTR